MARLRCRLTAVRAAVTTNTITIIRVLRSKKTLDDTFS
jgi:hypothetical protein